MPRQAIVITNPKWELFTKASDDFKAAKPPAVLVVRGRCKEKKSAPGESKVFKKSAESLAAEIAGTAKKAAKIAALIAVLFGFATAAFAQADITAKLPVALQEPATTNGVGAGTIGWNYNQVAVMQIAALSTNVAHATTRSNVVVRFDTSLNGTDWQTNVYAISVAPSLTASEYNNTIGTITNVGSKWLRVSSVENPNTNRVWLARFYFSID